MNPNELLKNISLGEANNNYVDCILLLDKWKTMDSADKAYAILSESEELKRVEYAQQVVDIIQGKETFYFDPIKQIYYSEKT